MSIAKSSLENLQNTEYKKRETFRVLKKIVSHFFSLLHFSFLTNNNKLVNIFVGDSTDYTSCSKLLISGNYLF